jgi:hypothetical protein
MLKGVGFTLAFCCWGFVFLGDFHKFYELTERSELCEFYELTIVERTGGAF